jgi:hypothetical protein
MLRFTQGLLLHPESDLNYSMKICYSLLYSDVPIRLSYIFSVFWVDNAEGGRYNDFR